MDEVKINTSKTVTLTLPSDPDSNTVTATLYHEFGDTVSGPTTASRTSAGVYSITYGQQNSGIYILNSGGRYRVDFTYNISGTSYTQSKYLNVFTPYITSLEFFINHPELETQFSQNFESFAKRAKNIIDTFCGQTFEYYPSKSMYMTGSGYSNMRLPLAISVLTEVIQEPATEDEFILFNSSVDRVEKVRSPFNFDTSWNIRFRKSSTSEGSLTLGFFNDDLTYKVKGDFGWRFVPENIKQAADILISDMMNNDSEYRNHGFRRVDMDSISFEMRDSFFDSTGNIEADVLLMDYTLFVMDYIV